MSGASGAETGAKALVEQTRWGSATGLDLELGISLGGVEQLDDRGVGCQELGGAAVVVEAWIAACGGPRSALAARLALCRRGGPACPRARTLGTVELGCHDLTAVVDGGDGASEGGARASAGVAVSASRHRARPVSADEGPLSYFLICLRTGARKALYITAAGLRARGLTSMNPQPVLRRRTRSR